MKTFEQQLTRVHTMLIHPEDTADRTHLESVYRHIRRAIQQSGNGAILLEELAKRRHDGFTEDTVIHTLQQHVRSDAWDALLTKDLTQRTPNGWDQRFSIPLTGSGYAAYHWYDIPTMLHGRPGALLLSTGKLDQELYDVSSALLHWIVQNGTARQVIGVLADTAKQITLPDARRSSVVQHVVAQCFLSTFDQTTQTFVMDREIPWAWQQPIFVNTWTEALRDVETMQGIYDLFRDRPGYGYYVLSED